MKHIYLRKIIVLAYATGLFSIAVSGAMPAFAVNSGIDTPGGVTVLPFSVTGTEMMDLTTTGLGIGQTNPMERLHIGGGTTTYNGGEGGVEITSGNGAGGARDFKAYVSNSDFSFHIRDLGYNSANNGPGYDAFTIQYNTGYVGIGITSPQAQLEIKGPGSTSLGNSANPLLRLQPNAGNTDAVLAFGAASSSVNRAAIYSTGSEVGGDTTGDLRFATGLAATAVNPAMVISGTGNVGIGVTSPSYTLDIAGSPTPLHTNTSANAGWGAYIQNTDSGGNRYVLLAGGAYSGIFMNGNVGIGNTNPNYKLDIYSTSSSAISALGNSRGVQAASLYGNDWSGCFGSNCVGGGSATAYGVYGNGTSWAGYFAGPIYVGQNLTFPDGTTQTTAYPPGAHAFGGMYGLNSGGAGPCQFTNPFTGNCSCPSGYNSTTGSSMPDHTNSWNTLVYCWK